LRREAAMTRRRGIAIGTVGGIVALLAVTAPRPATTAEGRPAAGEPQAAEGAGVDAAISALIGALKDDSDEVASAAYVALKEIGGKGVPPLLRTFRPERGTIRLMAARLLQSIGVKSEAVEEAFREAVKDEDGWIRDVAALYLLEHDERWFHDALKSEDVVVRRTALAVLTQHSGRTLWTHPVASGPKYGVDLVDSRRSQYLSRICEVLGEDTDAEVRALAAQIIGKAGGAAGETATPSTAQLVRILVGNLEKDPSPAVRAAAAKSLGQLGAPMPEVTTALARAYRGDPADGVRREALEALCSLGSGDATAVGVFRDALKQEAEAMRLKIVAELGRTGERSSGALALLIGALRDEAACVRKAAVEAIAETVAGGRNQDR